MSLLCRRSVNEGVGANRPAALIPTIAGLMLLDDWAVGARVPSQAVASNKIEIAKEDPKARHRQGRRDGESEAGALIGNGANDAGIEAFRVDPKDISGGSRGTREKKAAGATANDLTEHDGGARGRKELALDKEEQASIGLTDLGGGVERDMGELPAAGPPALGGERPPGLEEAGDVVGVGKGVDVGLLTGTGVGLVKGEGAEVPADHREAGRAERGGDKGRGGASG